MTVRTENLEGFYLTLPLLLATGSPRMGDLDRNMYIYRYIRFSSFFSILSPFQNNSCCYSKVLAFCAK